VTERTVSYPCPVCLKRDNKSEIRRREDGLFFCSKCGSKLNERQIKNKLSKLHDLRIASVYIKERNRRLGSSFRSPEEGDDPPDVISSDSGGDRLQIEICKYAPDFWAELLGKGTVSGAVDPIKWLIDALRVKVKKNYDVQYRKQLVLLLEGNVIADDFFEKNEKHFLELSFNKNALEKLGFKEVWYVSLTRSKAYQVY